MRLIVVLWYIALLLIIIGLISVASSLKDGRTVDARTQELCNEYAYRDHEKEISKERWDYLSSIGNPNDYAFFYKSCLNHIKCPVANKCSVYNNSYMGGNK